MTLRRVQSEAKIRDQKQMLRDIASAASATQGIPSELEQLQAEITSLVAGVSSGIDTTIGMMLSQACRDTHEAESALSSAYNIAQSIDTTILVDDGDGSSSRW